MKTHVYFMYRNPFFLSTWSFSIPVKRSSCTDFSEYRLKQDLIICLLGGLYSSYEANNKMDFYSRRKRSALFKYNKIK